MNKEEQNLNETQEPQLNIGAVSGSLFVSELEEFYYEMGEDWHLWDKFIFKIFLILFFFFVFYSIYICN